MEDAYQCHGRGACPRPDGVGLLHGHDAAEEDVVDVTWSEGSKSSMDNRFMDNSAAEESEQGNVLVIDKYINDEYIVRTTQPLSSEEATFSYLLSCA